MLTNDVFTALYLVMVKNTTAAAGLSATAMLFYNSALSMPLLLGAALGTGEMRSALHSSVLTNTQVTRNPKPKL